MPNIKATSVCIRCWRGPTYIVSNRSYKCHYEFLCILRLSTDSWAFFYVVSCPGILSANFILAKKNVDKKRTHTQAEPTIYWRIPCINIKRYNKYKIQLGLHWFDLQSRAHRIKDSFVVAVFFRLRLPSIGSIKYQSKHHIRCIYSL